MRWKSKQGDFKRACSYLDDERTELEVHTLVISDPCWSECECREQSKRNPSSFQAMASLLLLILSFISLSVLNDFLHVGN